MTRRQVFCASFIIFFISFPISVFCQKLLVADEVTSLKTIAAVLGKTDWNFSVDPCSFGGVLCDCSNSTTNCHVSKLDLSNQDLRGNLPRELINLRYLTTISFHNNQLTGTIPPEWGSFLSLDRLDLSRNLLTGSIPKGIGNISTLQFLSFKNNQLTGTIPPEWGSFPHLNALNLSGNLLTGSIPKEIGNISTLQFLYLEVNRLTGSIPKEIGNISALLQLDLSSNNFTGELPATLSRLTKLECFLICDNNFTGKIPDLFGNMTVLKGLMIQAGGFTGPIPNSINSLTTLTDLRITDLRGFEEQNFPPLSNLPNLIVLILRSCNIIGQLPDYGYYNWKALTTLDVSFNKLHGPIPNDFLDLQNLQNMYLTGNLLTGDVPNWIEGSRMKIDLSYNNFTIGNSTANCQEGNLNLFKMESSLEGNNSGLPFCMRSFECPTHDVYSFHINCGGNTLHINGTTFDSDIEHGGPSKFYKGGTNWAYSSTGPFMDAEGSSESSFNTYIATTNSSLNMTNSDLYMTARLSPTSLTYYGFCLINGTYTVSLHFAEIIFTSSLETRVFDVYIQGILVLKNFNIEDAAGGLGKVSIRKFNASVTSNTLEIRFYWAGRGTTNFPSGGFYWAGSRGTTNIRSGGTTNIRSGGFYGPLISAISVESHTKPKSRNSILVAILITIVVAVAFFISLVLVVLWLKGCLRGRDTTAADLKGLNLQTSMFTLSQIKAATNDFDAGNKIGEGGFGSVYKGRLSDGSFIAVKQLSAKSKQGNHEFVNEIGMISALQHPHLVKLYGCCVEGNQLLLVYEYMENNSLARALFGPKQSQLKLDWPTRQKICNGIARGLAYLHEESRLKIVHRDIKATNVLLDKNLNAKISDFGLAKLDEEENTHISTRVAGTYGYMAPEYAMWGYLTEKADVYSFGIVALEIVSGRSNISNRGREDCFNLLNWALDLKEEGMLIELVDPRLESKFNKEEAMRMINIALQCANGVSTVRPTMSSVVSMLEDRAVNPNFVSDSGVPVSFEEINATWNHNADNAEENTSGSMTMSLSTEEPITNSSASAVDLYPISQMSK